MGWKKVKEHYDIKHLVQVSTRREYDQKPCIFIGSPYISDIIVIRIEDGKILKRYTRGSNDLLDALMPKLDDDEKNGTLKAIIDDPDTFENVKPVYFYGDYRHVIEMECEEYGWPNTTTDGQLMYENEFAPTPEEARAQLLNRSKINWWGWRMRVADRFRDIGKDIGRLRFEFREVWTFVYVRLWGQFFVRKKKR